MNIEYLGDGMAVDVVVVANGAPAGV